MTREQQMMDLAKLAELNSRTIDLSKKQVFISAYIQGWLEADSHSQWIPVEQELPIVPKDAYFSDYYWVCNNRGKCFIARYKNKASEQYPIGWYDTSGMLRYYITYWMLLPEPPKNDE